MFEEFNEWLCKTNFSFLHGASHPQELVARAADGLADVHRSIRRHGGSTTVAEFGLTTSAGALVFEAPVDELGMGDIIQSR